jgi:hypothetical protein
MSLEKLAIDLITEQVVGCCMIYRYTLSSSPRALLLPAITLVLLALSVVALIFLGSVVGIIALLISAFLGYHLIKFFVRTIKSEVRVFDDQILFKTVLGSETRFDWDGVTAAGWYTAEDGERILFIYAEEDDQLISLPETYERMDELADEISEHIELIELHGETREDVGNALRELLYPEDVNDPDELDV